MKRTLAALTLTCIACGGGSSPTAPSTPTTPTTQPPTPATSVLSATVRTAFMTIRSQQQVSRLTLICADYDVDILIEETGGLPAVLTETDAFLREADGEIEGRRVTNQDNLPVPANGTVSIAAHRLACGYEGRDLPMTFVYTMSFVDDKNNVHTLQGETGFVRR